MAPAPRWALLLCAVWWVAAAAALPNATRPPRWAVVQILWGVPCGAWSRALGPLVTRAVLQAARSPVEHVVLANEVCAEVTAALHAAGLRVIPFRAEDVPRPTLGASVPALPSGYAHKLIALQLPTFEDGDVVVLLDDDAIPTQSIDELFALPFDLQEMWAAGDPEPTYQINTGVLAYRVSRRLSREFLALVGQVGGSLGDSDQDLISFFYHVTKGYRLYLGGQYNGHVPQLVENVRRRSHVMHRHLYLKVLHYTFGRVERWCDCLQGYQTIPSYLRILAEHCCAAQNMTHTFAGVHLRLCYRGRVSARPSPKVVCRAPKWKPKPKPRVQHPT